MKNFNLYLNNQAYRISYVLFRTKDVFYYIQCVILSLSCLSVQSFAATDAPLSSQLEIQRKQFWQAKQALLAGDIDNYQFFAEGLEDYPLSAYLDFLYLSRHLHRVPARRVLAFLRDHQPSPLAADLRRAWLRHLWRNKDWAGFIAAYQPQNNVTRQCQYIRSHLNQQVIEGVAVELPHLPATVNTLALNVWTVGKSQPEICNPVFEYLKTAQLINDERRWQRIILAMDNGKVGLGQFVSRSLEDPIRQTLFKQWAVLLDKNSTAKALSNFNVVDSADARVILINTLQMLARKDVQAADTHWQRLKKQYTFSKQEKGRVFASFALRAAWQKQADALTRFKLLTAIDYDTNLRQVFLQTALKAKAWQQIAKTIRQWSAELRGQSQWRYWLARALDKTGQSVQAMPLFKRQAIERDFYGFLAAEYLGKRHTLLHRNIPYTNESMQTLVQTYPNLLRAREFLAINQIGLARREWNSITQILNKEDLALSSLLAYQWCWYDRGIFTAAKAGFFDDLNVRYPLAFRAQLSAGAEEQDLDLAWVYGIVRQESAFMRRVTSSAGANGLMQVMPATAKIVAKKIGLNITESDALLDSYTNIRLGTGYLKSMLDKFNGSYPLASAAYNAGPGRAWAWAKKHACEPDDVWVELIPFKETRGYVRRVAAYTVLYEARLQNKKQVLPLRLSRHHIVACTQ